MQLHRLQLPVEAPHISTIAFDTEQELLWIGDETVSMIKSAQSIFMLSRLCRLKGYF